MESSERLVKKLAAVTDEEQKLKQVYLLLYGRAADDKELHHSLAFLHQLSATESPARAWALLCQSLMAANEFMYLR